jgi:hypothetical protein
LIWPKRFVWLAKRYDIRRLSLAPDGKSMAHGTGRFKRNLWTLEGPGRGFWRDGGFEELAADERR